MVLGIFSFRRLPIDQFPDVDIPVVVVQTVYPGASPETVEREVTRRLEEAFNPVQGVDRITSISLEGVSQIIVEFDLGRNGDQAAQDIRARIDAVRRDLPEDIEAPVVQKFDPSAQPILSLALSSSTLGVPELTRLSLLVGVDPFTATLDFLDAYDDLRSTVSTILATRAGGSSPSAIASSFVFMSTCTSLRLHDSIVRSSRKRRWKYSISSAGLAAIESYQSTISVCTAASASLAPRQLQYGVLVSLPMR